MQKFFLNFQKNVGFPAPGPRASHEPLKMVLKPLGDLHALSTKFSKNFQKIFKKFSNKK